MAERAPPPCRAGGSLCVRRAACNVQAHPTSPSPATEPLEISYSTHRRHTPAVRRSGRSKGGGAEDDHEGGGWPHHALTLYEKLTLVTSIDCL
jgi:hypothetical protein